MHATTSENRGEWRECVVDINAGPVAGGMYQSIDTLKLSSLFGSVLSTRVSFTVSFTSSVRLKCRTSPAPCLLVLHISGEIRFSKFCLQISRECCPLSKYFQIFVLTHTNHFLAVRPQSPKDKAQFTVKFALLRCNLPYLCDFYEMLLHWNVMQREG